MFFIDGDKRDLMLSSVGIDITNYCNLDCVHCLRDKVAPRKHMSLDTLKRILTETSHIGIRNSAITGGEIALHPQLKEVFEMHAEMKIPFNFVSNGIYFHEKILPLLTDKIKKFLTVVCFSLDGATEESHGALRGSGNFEAVIKSIQTCVRMGLPVSVKSVVHKKNLQEVEDIAFLCASLGVANLGYIYPTPTQRMLQANLMPSNKEWVKVSNTIKRKIMSLYAMAIGIEGASETTVKATFCNPARSLEFDHEGNMIFCCNLSNPTAGDKLNTLGKEFIANIHETDIKEAVLLHYERLGWFMERINKVNGDEGPSIGRCSDCFKLFGKAPWGDKK